MFRKCVAGVSPFSPIRGTSCFAATKNATAYTNPSSRRMTNRVSQYEFPAVNNLWRMPPLLLILEFCLPAGELSFNAQRIFIIQVSRVFARVDTECDGIQLSCLQPG